MTTAKKVRAQRARHTLLAARKAVAAEDYGRAASLLVRWLDSDGVNRFVSSHSHSPDVYNKLLDALSDVYMQRADGQVTRALGEVTATPDAKMPSVDGTMLAAAARLYFGADGKRLKPEPSNSDVTEVMRRVETAMFAVERDARELAESTPYQWLRDAAAIEAEVARREGVDALCARLEFRWNHESQPDADPDFYASGTCVFTLCCDADGRVGQNGELIDISVLLAISNTTRA